MTGVYRAVQIVYHPCFRIVLTLFLFGKFLTLRVRLLFFFVGSLQIWRINLTTELQAAHKTS